MKATHFGECQICGRKMKAPYGQLSNHGYTVDHGYFNGSCHGSHELPFEKDRSVLGEVISNFADHIKAKEQYHLDVKNGKEKYKVPVYSQRGFGSKKLWVDFVSVEKVPYDWDQDRFYEVYLIDPKELNGDGLYNYNRQYKLNDDGLIQFTDKENEDKTGISRYCLKLSYEIYNYKNTLNGLQKKYDSWKLKELDPIQKA
jgi:hypothetical protein